MSLKYWFFYYSFFFLSPAFAMEQEPLILPPVPLFFHRLVANAAIKDNRALESHLLQLHHWVHTIWHQWHYLAEDHSSRSLRSYAQRWIQQHALYHYVFYDLLESLKDDPYHPSPPLIPSIQMLALTYAVHIDPKFDLLHEYAHYRSRYASLFSFIHLSQRFQLLIQTLIHDLYVLDKYTAALHELFPTASEESSSWPSLHLKKIDLLKKKIQQFFHSLKRIPDESLLDTLYQMQQNLIDENFNHPSQATPPTHFPLLQERLHNLLPSHDNTPTSLSELSIAPEIIEEINPPVEPRGCLFQCLYYFIKH